MYDFLRVLFFFPIEDFLNAMTWRPKILLFISPDDKPSNLAFSSSYYGIFGSYFNPSWLMITNNKSSDNVT